jgi:AcrR family transcriptional regulator
MAAGRTPNVEEAAAAAGVSRATAYRYFPNQRALLVAAHPEIEATELLGGHPPDDPRERLDRTIAELIRLTIDTEPVLRTMLRLSLEPGPRDELLLRQGRAIGWIEEALAPLQGRLPPSILRRLVLAIRSACGIEALVWLTDVAGSRADRRESSCAGRRSRSCERRWPKPTSAKNRRDRSDRPPPCRPADRGSRPPQAS